MGYIDQPSNTACTSTILSTLLEGYTSFINTTGSNVVVTGLNYGTCYLFGVRVHSSKSPVPGKWTLLLTQTDTIGTLFTWYSIMNCNCFFNLVIGIDSVKCSCTSLIGGTVSGYVISVILLVALVIQTVWILYNKKRWGIITGICI